MTVTFMIRPFEIFSLRIDNKLYVVGYRLPGATVVGDGKAVIDACPEPYMNRDRYNATDKALDARYSYTGFLVVRVDSDVNIKDRRFKRAVAPPPYRQAHYKYSDYFEPVKFERIGKTGLF